MAYTCANHWRQSGDGVANFGFGLSYFGHGVVWTCTHPTLLTQLQQAPRFIKCGFPP